MSKKMEKKRRGKSSSLEERRAFAQRHVSTSAPRRVSYGPAIRTFLRVASSPAPYLPCYFSTRAKNKRRIRRRERKRAEKITEPAADEEQQNWGGIQAIRAGNAVSETGVNYGAPFSSFFPHFLLGRKKGED